MDVAKAELRDHRKFLKLKRLLGEPTPHVMGYLECMWLRGYQTGSPYLGDAADVEGAAEYPGEVGKFARAASESGFIDQDDDGNYSIHDLWDHAPNYVKKRMSRLGTAPDDSQTGTKTPKRRPRGTKKAKNVPTRTDLDATRPDLDSNSGHHGAQRREKREERVEKKEERQDQDQGNPTDPAMPVPLDTARFRDAWKKWERHRREIKAPLKPTQADSQLAKLATEGETAAVGRIERSIANGWQGLWFKEDERPPARASPDLRQQIQDNGNEFIRRTSGAANDQY